MTFYERYQQEKTWSNKATVMGLFHITMRERDPHWSVTSTANYFDCSIGLASENIKLADAIHSHPKILRCETRQDAIKFLGSHR